MKYLLIVLQKGGYLFTMFALMGTMGFTGLYLYLGPNLPNADSIRDIRLQTPMTVHTSSGELIAEFGDKRRIPITLSDVPQSFIHALIATEDQRFYEHSGVDFIGVMRAIVNMITTGTRSQGASTITQLVARNVYLHRKKTFTRKFREMFLAWKIETELSKNEILELFLNKAHFSHRAYGLGAAAQVYYGKLLKDLTLPQLAVLAGIPKGESIYNPLSNPERALNRRNHVLKRMFSEKYITEEVYQEAIKAPITAQKHGAEVSIDAYYVAELVRRHMIDTYGREAAYSNGFKVFTTVKDNLQLAAQNALRQGFLEYDRRHGYRGRESVIADFTEKSEEDLKQLLQNYPVYGGLLPSLVTEMNETSAKVLLGSGETVEISWDGMKWARPFIDTSSQGPAPKIPNDIFSLGDIVRVYQSEENIWYLSQIPEVSGGIVALDPNNGAISAMVGGFDFNLNQFNMITQARRQPGSNIKPFIYSAALEKNFTAASVLNDAPIVEEDITAEEFWRPKNDSGKYKGATRLRDALRFSNNAISIRLMKAIGPSFAEDYLKSIGFPDQHMSPVPSLALGTANFTPLEVATGYATFANGGYKISPYFIERVETSEEDIIFQAEPITVCSECEDYLTSKLLTEKSELNSVQMEQVTPTGTTEEQLSSNTPNENSVAHAEKSLEIAEERITIPYDPNAPLRSLPEMRVDKAKIAPRVIEARNAYIINSMMKDVIHRGTAWRTLNNSKSPLLRRQDIAGKTGTTNDAKDAWFSGFNGQLVATAWMGYADYSLNLGNREFGGKAALPIWQRFMEVALDNHKYNFMKEPPGIVTARIDSATGKLANSRTENVLMEIFRKELVPEKQEEETTTNIFEENPGEIF